MNPENTPEQETVQFGWRDIVALMLAGYRLVLPGLLVTLGGIILVGLLLKLYFR